ncbi:MAG: site-specific integrase [Armatimonadetes bacterium]|nr:site-specific integrase [Armatimonadota bacterium]
MQKRPPPFAKPAARIPVADSQYHFQCWLLDGEIRQLSPRTLDARRSCDPKRNEALLVLLLDTGARASEVCALQIGDLDPPGGVHLPPAPALLGVTAA